MLTAVLFLDQSKALLSFGLLAILMSIAAKTHASDQFLDSKQMKLQLAAASISPRFNGTKIRKLSHYVRKKYRIPRQKASVIVKEAFRNGAKHDVRPELILAIIAVESSFRERAVSRVGARGLMQIMPRAHPKKVRAVGGVRALFDPRKNIHTGSKILVDYLGITRGNLRKALLRYNGSLGNPRSRYPEKVLREYQAMRRATR